MRLVIAGLMVASLFVVASAPSASACRIDMSDPTAPRWSDGCTDPDHLITVEIDGSSEDVEALDSVCTAETVCSHAIDAHIAVDGDDARLDLNVQYEDTRSEQRSLSLQVHQPVLS